MAEMLKVNTALTSIDVGFNSLEEEVALDILTFSGRRKSRRHASARPSEPSAARMRV